MRERVAELCALLLLAIIRALLPAGGRHRAAPTPSHFQEPTLARTARRAEQADLFESADAQPLVRPYLLTPEERHERRLQGQRRRALWLAVHGIDVGPRRIHGMEVSA
ncbi:hypothetical protein OG342_19270 [Streptomyces bobili]|uniref:hypothetical protein n=1 Tax=Streptomyces bobili TaxID=67280 RepID=UPI00225725CE|nr:hypothetical protein [Streptomyces bobili]MCX5524984.1 hypothetical protein [Streptomyces bobili]